MAESGKKKGTLAILTGGGDVPGLNPAIRAITMRALREGYEVLGLMRGWAGLLEIERDPQADNSKRYMVLTEELVNQIGTTGGTFLKTSRTNPAKVELEAVPLHLRSAYSANINDLTPEVLKNIDYLNIDYLIPIGGDDTLNYAVKLYEQGVKIIGIPKTMDNDVMGTDYCIGFSTCVTRIINMSNALRQSSASHERILVVEVFGRYAGFTAVLPTMAGAANRCVIPEHKFDIELLTDLLVYDRKKSPQSYSIVLISEGARFEGYEQMMALKDPNEGGSKAHLGGIGLAVSQKIREISPRFTGGEKLMTIHQQLGYLVRSGDPDAIDAIVPMAFGNMALDMILKGIHGRLIVLKNGRYDNVPLDVVTRSRKLVDVKRHYNTERYRPIYKTFEFQPLFLMTGGYNV